MTNNAIRIAWQYADTEDGEGADMIAVHNGVVVVLHDFCLAALDLGGRRLWLGEAEFESSGSGRLAFTDDTVVVEDAGETLAYDLRTGDSRPIPTGLVHPPSTQSVLPPGYDAEDGVLRYQGRSLVELADGSFPQVGRLGDITIINDFEMGLFAVDDDGTEVLRVDLGECMFGECNIVVDNDLAVTVGTDGVVYAFRSA